MESTRVENLPPPPGVIKSIKAGFDAIATRLSAILLPILLDLYLWLGPRLRMDALFNSVKNDVVSIWLSGGIPAKDIQQMLDWYEKTIPSINLFWFLRTLPIGISSLFFSQEIAQTPLGTPVILQVTGFNLFGLMILITLVGWIGGSLYFRGVAWLVTASENDQPIRATRAIGQTILVSILWSILSILIGVPLFLIILVLLQFSQILVNIAILLLSLASMWLIVPLFFWPHGVFLKKQNFFASILSSFQMARFTLPTSSMFILTVFLLSWGLNYLWSIPPRDSWMTLVGIFGHAFVTTALLAASFIYYRDMNAWLQTVIERLRSNAPKRA
jgi:hypothetical protein